MPTNLTEATFDKRLMRARRRAGTISAEQTEEFLKSLPDCADECEESEVEFTTPCADRIAAKEAEESE